MPTFRELLSELDKRRNEPIDSGTLHYRVIHHVDNLEWAIYSILERLANWEEFRDNHPNKDGNDA